MKKKTKRKLKKILIWSLLIISILSGLSTLIIPLIG
jgi:hypothetical protein